MFWNFIFFRSDLSSLSPAVSVWWPGKVIDLLNRLPEHTLYWGNMAQGACADFVVACRAIPETNAHPLEVNNLGLRWDRQKDLGPENDTREYADRWRNWVFEEIAWMSREVKKPSDLPVLVQLDPPFHVTQGGIMLCRHLDLTHEQWEPDQPYWVSHGSGSLPEPCSSCE